MPTAHLTNLALHVAAGTAAILLGARILLRPLGDAAHRRAGLRFVRLTGVVVTTAALGLAVVRWMPLFAVLTLLVGYQLVSGLRAARTRGAGPQARDAGLTVLALVAGVALARVALAEAPGAGTVLRSTLGALGAVLAYDVLRWGFPARWHARAWRYEHLYKMNAALFGMVSAFIGNTVRAWQPWSQLLPSALGLLVIGGFAWREWRTPAAV